MLRPEFAVLMDFPGWTRYQEIVNICDYILKNEITDVLAAGTFGGRVASAICRSFPAIHVTAIDTFRYNSSYGELRSRTLMTCGDAFVDNYQSLLQFKTMHDYPNIAALQEDFINYNVKHQLIIIELYPESADYTWEMIFDHSLSLGAHIIGACSQLGEKNGISGMDVLRNLYDYEIFSSFLKPGFEIYKILNKKS